MGEVLCCGLSNFLSRFPCPPPHSSHQTIMKHIADEYNDAWFRPWQTETSQPCKPSACYFWRHAPLSAASTTPARAQLAVQQRITVCMEQACADGVCTQLVVSALQLLCTASSLVLIMLPAHSQLAVMHRSQCAWRSSVLRHVCAA